MLIRVKKGLNYVPQKVFQIWPDILQNDGIKKNSLNTKSEPVNKYRFFAG